MPDPVPAVTRDQVDEVLAGLLHPDDELPDYATAGEHLEHWQDQARKAAAEIVRLRAATPPCPHVVTDGTTSHCGLAEAEVARLQDEWQDAEGELRLRIRVQAAVIARINDGWDYVRPDNALRGSRGIWWRVQNGAGEWVLQPGADSVPQEPMTEAEQRVIYGQPATEGADRGA